MCHPDDQFYSAEEPRVPLDELDLAEELAECLSDPAFPDLSDPEMNDYVDTLAGLYAQEERP